MRRDLIGERNRSPELPVHEEMDLIGERNRSPDASPFDVLTGLVATEALRKQAAKQHANQHASDDTYEWYTPEAYIEAARRVMGSIEIDPASCAEANKVVQAARYYDRQTDGLSQPWRGNIWLNPPYNMPWIERFVDKAIEAYDLGNAKQLIILTNNATDTRWFHRLLERSTLCLTLGRPLHHLHWWLGDWIRRSQVGGEIRPGDG